MHPYCRWIVQAVPCPSAKLSEKKHLWVFSQLLADPLISFSRISLLISSLLQASKNEDTGLTLAPGLLLVCGFAWCIWMLMSWYLVKGTSRTAARAGGWGFPSSAGGG